VLVKQHRVVRSESRSTPSSCSLMHETLK